MDRQLYVILIKILEHYSRLSFQKLAIHREHHVYSTRRFPCFESLLCCHRLSVYHERLSCFFVHKRACQLVCLALLQTLVLYSIYDDDFAFRFSEMRFAFRIFCCRFDLDTIISHGAHRDGHRVPVDADFHFQKVHTFICLASLLCDLIIIIDPCTFSVVRLRSPEPDTVLRGLSCIGVMCMSVPGCCCAGVSVLISHYRVALTCRKGGYRKRHAFKSLEISVRYFNEFQVTALHLLRHALLIVSLNRLLHTC